MPRRMAYVLITDRAPSENTLDRISVIGAERDGIGNAIIALSTRPAALGLREEIRRADPDAEVRIYEQPRDEEPPEDDWDFADEPDRDGVFVLKEPSSAA